MGTKIIRTEQNGCDFILQLGEERKGTKIKLLQLTDMQIIDSMQQRTAGRLRSDETAAWLPEKFEKMYGNHVRSLLTQTKPDMIFITGDMVYGSFDDNGTTFAYFCKLMDSFEIPWAPVFGNHDNESQRGVAWQCQQFENSTYCMFKRGSVTGNSNYTIGVATGDKLVCALHMLDSNGCVACEDSSVEKLSGIYPDQIELVQQHAKEIQATWGEVPGMMAFHIPTIEFTNAELAAGYAKTGEECYVIGVDVPEKNGDFGCKYEKILPIHAAGTAYDFLAAAKKCNVKVVCAGHYHNVNTCITYEDIKWVYGLKTGQYDYHMPGQLGGTLYTLESEKEEIEIAHVPALVAYGQYPGQAPMFQGFFAE